MKLSNSLYSVPKNYGVIDVGGLKGLIRQDKKGEKWILKPVYRNVIVAKSYGKIFVCKDAGIYADFMTLHTYTGKLVLDTKIYDIIFGADFIYILTDRPSTGTVEWCLLDKEMKGGKFIGAVEFLERGTHSIFHMRLNTKVTPVKLGDTIYNLELSTGEMEEKFSKVEAVETEETPVTHGDVVFVLEGDYNQGVIKRDTNSIQIVNSTTKRVITHSGSLGDIEQCQGIIEKILGGLENIPIERCIQFIRLTRNLEKFANSIILPILYYYVVSKLGNSTDKDTIIREMNNELESDWSSLGEDRVKGYITGSIGVILTKRREDRIIVTPFMINEPECTARLQYIGGEVLESDAEDFKDFMQLPYCIEQRKDLVKAINKFNYKGKEFRELVFDIKGLDNKNYGKLVLTVARLTDLIYRVVKKNAEISTAKMHMVIVNNE